MPIRQATPDDAEGIAAAHVASWREAYGGIVPADYLRNLSIPERSARWRKTLQEKAQGTGVAVLELEGQIAGFCSTGPAREASFGFTGELYAIYLLQAAQGQGWGRKLFEAGQNSLKSFGMNDMYLWVLRANRAGDFYRHMGGVECGAKMLDIGGAALEEVALGCKEIP